MLSTLSNVIARRDLLRVLVQTQLRASTAQRRLGWLWWLIDPLLMMLIYWGIVVGLFGRGNDRYAPYWVFIFFGLLTWKQVTQCVTKAADVLRGHRNLIRSIPFPTVVLPVSNLLSSFVLFLVGFAVLLAMSAVAPNARHSGDLLPLVQLPLLFALHVGVLTGVVLALSCYGLVFRDLAGLIPHFLRVGFYLSPTLYGADLVRETLVHRLQTAPATILYSLYMLNPFALLITGYRASVFDGTWIAPLDWALLGLEAAFSVLVGYRIYHHHDRRVIKFL